MRPQRAANAAAEGRTCGRRGPPAHHHGLSSGRKGPQVFRQKSRECMRPQRAACAWHLCKNVKLRGPKDRFRKHMACAMHDTCKHSFSAVMMHERQACSIHCCRRKYVVFLAHSKKESLPISAFLPYTYMSVPTYSKLPS